MSETIGFIFFVSEAEYPKLQTACPADFPFIYGQFVDRVDKGIEQMSETVTVIKVYANVEEFLAWCAENKVQPNNKSRAEYAIAIGRAKRLH
jgi:hypothetical protein